MHMRTNVIGYYIGLLLPLVIPLCSAGEIDRGVIVGSVGEAQITYGDIHVTLEAAMLKYGLSHGHDASTEAEMIQVEQIKRKTEIGEFAERIREILFAQEVARLRIEVSEREVRKRWEKLTDGMDLDEAAKRERQAIEPLLSSLKAVYEGGQDRATVYRERLRDTMTPGEWAIHLNYYRTPQRRAILEDAISKTAKEWERPDEGIRTILVQEKLNEAIERELTRSDPEFTEYVRLAKTDPSNEKVQSKGPNYVAARRHEWWQQRYREAKVEIKDDRFKGAWKEPFE